MVTGTLAFLCGILLLQFLAELPPLMVAFWLLPVLLPAVVWPAARRWIMPLAWACAGFLWAWLQAASILGAGIASEHEGADLQVEGVVSSLPENDGERLRFQFDVEQMRRGEEELPLPGRLRLAWYAPYPELIVGERWRLLVRLKQPHGMANPGGFDYEGWLFQQQIRATGYVRSDAGNGRLPEPATFPLQRLRQGLRDKLEQALGDHPLGGIVVALVLGERQGIDAAQWQVFTRTGTNHLMAISGLHIGIVAGLLFFLTRRLWPWWPGAAHRLPAPQAAAIVALLGALLYATLAGFSIPTQRALLMVSVAMGALLLRRPLQPPRTLALALLAVLLWDPLAVLAPGFWLSFGAVALILYGMSGRLLPGGWWWQWGRVQWLVSLGLAPLLVFWFQQVALVAPLANLLAVPWMSFTVVPLALLGSLLLSWWPAMAGWLLQLTLLSLDGLWWLLEALAGSVSPGWGIWAPPLWTLLPALAGLIWLLAPRGVPARWLGLGGLLPALLIGPPVPPAGQVWVTMLDVGQGLAVVVQTRRHALVFDTGPRLGPDFDTGRAALVPFLRQRGIGRLDVLVISHGDNDHIGGARSLLGEIPAMQVFTSVPERMAWLEHAVCRRGQRWTWDGVDFEVLHPGAVSYRGNDGSCVLRVATAAGAVLLPGDIEAAAERELVREVAGQLRAEVLIAPHHGSKTSSTAPFLEAVAPRHVLLPIGYRNRYRFPHPDVTARYRQLGVERFDSASHGAVTVVLGEGAPRFESWRQQARRYWHHR